MDAPDDDDEPSELAQHLSDFDLGEIAQHLGDLGLGDVPARACTPVHTLESVVPWAVPRWLQLELGWLEPYGPPPRIVWYDRRSWQWWGWLVVYVVAAVLDLVVIVAAAAGQ
jgi:hypothetical protein